MYQNRFLSFIKHSFQGSAWILLISVSLAGVILLVVSLLRESGGEVRRSGCASEGFIHSLNLIAPLQLGINQWGIGDFARYRHSEKQSPIPNEFDREIGFHIIGELEKSGSHRYWLKKSGLRFHQKETIPMDLYHWVTVHDLRMTSENLNYEDPLNYFPSRFTSCDQTRTPLAKLIELGKADIQTEAGTFECVHYRAELKWDDTSLEIWASPAVRPLGIVRAESETEVLELIAFGQQTEITIPKLIKPIIEGISTLKDGCTSCHGYDNCHEMFFPPK